MKVNTFVKIATGLVFVAVFYHLFHKKNACDSKETQTDIVLEEKTIETVEEQMKQDNTILETIHQNEEVCNNLIDEIVNDVLLSEVEENVDSIVDLSNLSVAELKKLAKKRNISGYSRLKKDDLLNILYEE